MGEIENILQKQPAWYVQYGLSIAFVAIVFAFIILYNVKYEEATSFLATISLENKSKSSLPPYATNNGTSVFISGFISHNQKNKIKVDHTVNININKSFIGQPARLTGIVRYISAKPAQNGFYFNIELIKPAEKIKAILNNPTRLTELNSTIIHSNKTIGQLLFEKLLPY